MILDQIEMLDFPNDKVKAYRNEFQSLRNLSQGLSLLYESTRRIEQKAKEQIKDDSVLESMPPEVRKSFEGEDIRYFSAGNDPSLAWLNKGLLYCFFHWYSVSACNYVRLVGWLSQQEDAQRPKPREYVDSVIPGVLCFRDKIAAHFARAGYNERDTEADRVASVLYQVGFKDGRFYAPIWKVTARRGGKESTSTNEGSWSITEIHEALCKRYKPKVSGDKNG